MKTFLLFFSMMGDSRRAVMKSAALEETGQYPAHIVGLLFVLAVFYLRRMRIW
jgi:hypothetical protein